jgi:NAD(P)-dependent dehydrogenase (short-subunit alcohol dehydrogenase family)
MAVDLAPYNIRVNAVCPGFVYETRMTEGLASDKKAMEEMKKAYLIKQLGRPKDIAPTVLHLASDDSGFTTGSFVLIDGGHTIW